MDYTSILFESHDTIKDNFYKSQPAFFTDLNLDQLLEEILDGKEEYELEEYFYNNLREASAVLFRHEILRDLQNPVVYGAITNFANNIKKAGEFISFSMGLHNSYQREKWLLDSAFLYCNALMELVNSQDLKAVNSKGLNRFIDFIKDYTNRDYFKTLLSDTSQLNTEFNDIHYSIQLEEDKLIIGPDTSPRDYCHAINSTFEAVNEEKFDYRISFFNNMEMCSLEIQILLKLIKANEDTFEKLGRYHVKHKGFFDSRIKDFEREIRFYTAINQYIEKLKLKGLHFCYPEILSYRKISIADGYDLALAQKKNGPQGKIIGNDFFLSSKEKISILTGPNQGGKTTFARAFGQILFLAAIGCPVPGRSAEVFLFDNLFTHFSKEENLSTNTGRLKEELLRLNSIFQKITPESIIIINELFSTTTSFDAYQMGKKALVRVLKTGCICLYITHIYELTDISNKIVSLVAVTDQHSKARRTYKIVRKPADGLAYAESILQKYDLLYNAIKERISNEAITSV